MYTTQRVYLSEQMDKVRRARPLVSVVMPTYCRPALARRAVASALMQRLPDLEVVSVVDGRDRATVQALEALDDERLRIIVPEKHLGNGAARNRGIRAARAPWVALLDDDDEWLPGKLSTQLRHARASSMAFPVITSRLVARREEADFVWPRRRPEPGEPLSEYLFCRHSPVTGEGLVQTSTLLVPRVLARRVPFAADMRRYVDLDWLLRAAQQPGFELLFAGWPRPLAVWHIEQERTRISNVADGAYALAWAEAHRPLLTADAYAAFVLWRASDDAVRSGRHPSFATLLRAALRGGRVRPVDLLTHTLNFAVPQRVLHRAAAAVGSLRG